MTREQKINWACIILLAGFVSGVVYHYVQGAYLGRPYPDNTFLFRPADRGSDFLQAYNGWNGKPTAVFTKSGQYIAHQAMLQPLMLGGFLLFLFARIQAVVVRLVRSIQVDRVNEIIGRQIRRFLTR